MPTKSSKAKPAGRVAPGRQFPKKVLVLGSGALQIGQAGEFDYSGSQAIKALKEEGVQTVLINPNIATNQTSKGIADRVYFLPVTPEFVERVLEKERPDGVFLSFGGQTALNCGVKLEEAGVFKKYNCRVLGTPVASIQATEDREIFVDKLNEIGVRTARAKAVKTVAEGLAAAKKIGYPVIARAAFALGGKGSGFAENEDELKPVLENAFAESPQVLIEENLKGWKEIEYEVVRDKDDTCLTICNMENLDPMGIHTGESIVIAPSQTLDNSEYHGLREIAIRTIRHLGIVGECNIQYTLNPNPKDGELDYRVIEVNARLSRSSALASKATGYPLAYVAAKLALGYRLDEIKNAVTGSTTACFEPALDYCVLKVPRWDLQKFRRVDSRLGSEMKSVGEVMAIGRTFEETLQKALRMLQIGAYGFSHAGFEFKDLAQEIAKPTPHRVFAVARALRDGWSTKKIHDLSKIDPWFLEKMKKIVDFEQGVLKKKGKKISKEELLRAKQLGFSDSQIAWRTGEHELDIRKRRKQLKITPWVKKIDTFAGEFPAKTNYLYLSYHGAAHDTVATNPKKKKAIVLGSGAYCIGSSVEFDWSCVSAIRTLAQDGFETVMINYNPETVSTDYDTCDQLYFDELSAERVLDIVDRVQPTGVVVSTGGQIANNLVGKLAKERVPILGTAAKNIHRAESRELFSKLCDELGIDQPDWAEFTKDKEALEFAKKVGYPVLVRPSYVLSGAAMSVAFHPDQLRNYLARATKVSVDAPVVITKFEENAKEIDFDGVAAGGELLIYAVSEHVEQAGVHSGDATLVFPPQRTYLETIKRARRLAKRLAQALEITGPFNIQFIAKNNRLKVIELNLRASRSVPFVSKVSGHNFIEIAVDAMLGRVLPLRERREKYQTLDLDHVGVKAAQFSFSRLKGADPTLGVEMASTGEVGCFGHDVGEALLKSLLSTGFKIPKKAALISAGALQAKVELLPAVRKLASLGLKIYATPGTQAFLAENGIQAVRAEKDMESPKSALKLIESRQVDLVVNIPTNYQPPELTAGYRLRRMAIDRSIPLLTNLQLTKMTASALAEWHGRELPIEPWDSFVS